MRKKVLSLVLALVMCLGLCVPAAAAGEAEEFVIENGVLVEYNGEGGDVMIPSGVISIGYNAFGRCTSLTSVNIPDSVTAIGDYAFYYCTSLTSVDISNNVTAIGDFAFTGCSNLTSVKIPDGVTVIGEYAFWDCTSLTSISIPDSVIRIKSCAFSGCASLTSVNIPTSVTSIESGVFSSCASLTSINIPTSITSIEESAFYGCTSLTGISIPSRVTSIGEESFRGCTSLTSISIPSGVTSIGDHAFRDCTSLTSISIPSSIEGYTNLGSSVCKGCTALTDIYYGGTKDQGSIVFFFNWEEFELATIHYNSTLPTALPASAASVTAVPTASTVLVNGRQVAFDAYNIGGANYFKLRDLAFVLNGTEKQFSVGWDNASKTIALTSGGSYAAVGGELASGASGSKTAKPSAAKLLVDGQEISLAAYDIGGNNYFKLRDIGEVFDFGIGWDNNTKTIAIDTSTGYTPG